MQRCPLPWFQGRSRPHWEPSRHNPKCFLRRIHHHPGSFVRLLFLIQVGPSTNFCTTRDRNTFVNRIGKPFIYLPVCMALWDLISILTGVSHDFIRALLTRFFLGICECAFFPVSCQWRIFRTCSHGIAALLPPSKWYKRSELGLLTAVLACGTTLSNAFGSLITSMILDGMEGVLGCSVWRWYVAFLVRIEGRTV